VTDGGRVRCRIAPAPTGYLHVGNARAALFNWLFARHHGGVFVLRVEDTDLKRSTEEAIGIIISSLRWLGLDWDEGPEVGGDFGPYRQTEALESYQQTAGRLIDQGKAYVCYDTPDELEERRRSALARGQKPGYDGRCRNLSEEERRRFQAEGRPQAIRFAMSGEDVTVNDLIRGEVQFGADDLRDFVILRSDGTPTYLLAAAVDDVRMEMTHVIRGEDLLPSTPRQLEIIKTLGVDPPAYAHLPLIMGPDHRPLSKRHGAVAVEWFREQGFVPEAMVNYLALLGWSYDAETTFFSRDELIEKFDLAKVSHNPAAFDVDKLTWMNGHYIREADDARLSELVHRALLSEGLDANSQPVAAAIPLIKTRMQTIREGAGLIRFLFVDEVVPDDAAKKMLGAERADYLREAASRLEAIEEWTHQEIDRVLRALKDERGLSSKQAFQPIRAAVTGTLVSPPLFESLELLGQERALGRLRAAADASQPLGREPTS
jgi:glutamyl-tRNA synthetase